MVVIAIAGESCWWLKLVVMGNIGGANLWLGVNLRCGSWWWWQLVLVVASVVEIWRWLCWLELMVWDLVVSGVCGGNIFLH